MSEPTIAEQLREWIEREVMTHDQCGVMHACLARDAADELERLAAAEAENARLRAACEVKDDAIRVAIADFQTVNDTLVKMCRVHPFTLTPRQLHAALSQPPTASGAAAEE